jgi:hypothetical protein
VDASVEGCVSVFDCGIIICTKPLVLCLQGFLFH